MRSKVARFFECAVGNNQSSRLALDQRQHHTAGRTARAEQEHAFAGNHKSAIGFNVAHETGAVGVVGKNFSTIELQRIGSLRLLGALAAPRRHRPRLDLERQCNIDTAPPRIAKRIDRRNESIIRRKQTRVFQICTGLCGEGAVDLR